MLAVNVPSDKDLTEFCISIPMEEKFLLTSSAQKFSFLIKTPDTSSKFGLAADGSRELNSHNCLKNKRSFFRKFVNLLEVCSRFLNRII